MIEGITSKKEPLYNKIPTKIWIMIIVISVYYTHLDVYKRQDQGTIYSSVAFNNAHIDYNITRSMSRIPTLLPTLTYFTVM